MEGPLIRYLQGQSFNVLEPIASEHQVDGILKEELWLGEMFLITV